MKIIIVDNDDCQLTSMPYSYDGELKIDDILEQDEIKYKLTKFKKMYYYYIIFEGERID
jgi:hypothetical protein